MAEPVREGAPRLDNAAVRDRLTRLDGLLEQVEAIPGPSGEIALAAVSALAEVYGEALARAIAYTSYTPGLTQSIVEDELLGHLLVLHDIHPDPVQRRVTRALDDLRPALQERGGDVELSGIDRGVAMVQLSIKGCSSAGVEDAVREAVLTAAPELSDVQRAPAAAKRDAAFIPVDALLSRSCGAGP
ncbi:MAG: NifU family protein [Pseudonocardiales bacterium]|nr:NifU family protein [Pseudonocardiales bacterium]